jgi:putative signal transducing protein
MPDDAWVDCATAPNQMTAELWVSILRDNDIAAMIRPSDAVSFLGVSALSTRVQVRREDLERARELLGEGDESAT